MDDDVEVGIVSVGDSVDGETAFPGPRPKAKRREPGGGWKTEAEAGGVAESTMCPFSNPGGGWGDGFSCLIR